MIDITSRLVHPTSHRLEGRRYRLRGTVIAPMFLPTERCCNGTGRDFWPDVLERHNSLCAIPYWVSMNSISHGGDD